MTQGTNKPHVVILGAGPAGVGAAWRLALKNVARVTVLEASERVGGNAGSFDLEGLRVDYGSHRLHPACEPHILKDLRELLGDDLLDRPRHGRIRLGGRWIHFPLKPVDLLLRLPKPFAFGVAMDMARKLLPVTNHAEETFATVLERGLGRTICREFYFPYARKLWGLEPEALAVTQAKRRVSGSSLGKLVKKVTSQIPGLKPPGAGRFFYPRRGYGQICERIAEVAQAAGAEIHFHTRVTGIEREGNHVRGVHLEKNGAQEFLAADTVWSTLPISLVTRGVKPAAPAEVLSAAEGLDYRGMILIYLILGQDQFSEYDAHYFPEAHIPICRMSEPKNYCVSAVPKGKTILCAELPCDPSSREWQMSDDELGKLFLHALDLCGIPARAPVVRVETRKLKQAYPMYRRGYEEKFARMDGWLDTLEGLLTFGRQGLFAHDNTHHALFMAYSAVECFGADGRFDREKWAGYRKIFETHVVED